MFDLSAASRVGTWCLCENAMKLCSTDSGFRLFRHTLALGGHAAVPLQTFQACMVGQSINQSKRKTSNANGQTNLGHKHKAPDHNHEATQPMVDLPHTS